MISIPTYAMYRDPRRAARRPRDRRPAPRRKADGWAMDVAGGPRRGPRGATLVWVCNPNNPTGRPEPEGAIESLLEGIEDDADADGRPRARGRRGRGLQRVRRAVRDPACGRGSRTWSSVRTASKAYALAGLRVGFAVGGRARRSAGSRSTGRRARSGRSPRRPSRRRCATRARCARTSPASRRERPRLRGGPRGGRAADPQPSVTNFLLLDLVTPERAEAASPRAHGPRPRPAHVRARPPARPLPARDRPRPRRGRPPDRGRPRDRPDPAARRPPRRPPHDHARSARSRSRARDARRVRVARTTRETDITIVARPRRHRVGPMSRPASASTTTCSGSLAHHGLFDLEIRATGDLHVDEHHTVEDVALVLGAAFAEALGDRAGIRRFGDSAVPMDESRRDGGHRRRRAAVRRDRPAVPRRARRARSRSSSSTTRWSRSRGRPGRRSTCAARGRNDHHLAEAAFKALGRALRVACEPDPAAERRRVDEGLARMTEARATRRPLVVVVDYGAGNLVSIDQALRAAGARRAPARRAATRSTAPDLLVVPGVGRGRAGDGAGCAPAASSSRSARGSRADRPFLGICLGLQLLFEGSRRGRRRDAGRPARPDRPPRGRPDAAPHRLEPGRAPPRAPGLRRHRARRRLLLRPLLRRGARRPARATPSSPRPSTARRFVVRGRARQTSRRPVPPRAVRRRTACA